MSYTKKMSKINTSELNWISHTHVLLSVCGLQHEPHLWIKSTSDIRVQKHDTVDYMQVAYT